MTNRTARQQPTHADGPESPD